MKTNVINTASENVTSFVINEDMLNEKKASVEGEKKSAPRIGDAETRLNTYAEELKLKEALVADEKVAEKYTKEELKAIRHRIASLKRKIERANKALGTK